MSSTVKLLLASVLAVQAGAATIKIESGPGGLVFSPNETKAAVGDVLEFHFIAGNHSVVQGDFDNACHPSTTGGFYSGYLPASNGENPNVFSVTVNSTEPIAFYCSQGQHCQGGMVGVINPTNEMSFASYAAAAKSATQNVAPPAVFGGIVGPAPKETSSTTSSSATASPTTSATPSASTKPNGAGIVSASCGAIVAAVGFAIFLA